MNSSGRCSEARVHRWQSTLGLAMRARKVVMGDAVLKSIQNQPTIEATTQAVLQALGL